MKVHNTPSGKFLQFHDKETKSPYRAFDAGVKVASVYFDEKQQPNRDHAPAVVCRKPYG